MARYGSAIESQAAMLAGMPATTTVNGFIGYLAAGSTAGYRLRRLKLGVRAGASVPTSQQITIRAHRLTVAPSGTGLASAVVGEPLEFWTPTDPTGGLIATTATTIGTTGPTLNTNPIDEYTFNSQSYLDVPIEQLEELVCNKGTANGIAFVNIGNTLPASHLVTVSVEWEV